MQKPVKRKRYLACIILGLLTMVLAGIFQYWAMLAVACVVVLWGLGDMMAAYGQFVGRLRFPNRPILMKEFLLASSLDELERRLRKEFVAEQQKSRADWDSQLRARNGSARVIPIRRR